MVNYYIQYTSMVPSKVMTRCKLGVRPPSRVGRESVERGAVSAKPTLNLNAFAYCTNTTTRIR